MLSGENAEFHMPLLQPSVMQGDKQEHRTRALLQESARVRAMLADASASDAADLYKQLIDVNERFRNTDAAAAMHYAAKHGFVDQMRAILPYKPDIWIAAEKRSIPNAYQKAKDAKAEGEKETVLVCAVQHPNPEGVALLFEACPDIRERKEDCENALLLAATLGHEHVVDVFLKTSGLDVNDPMFTPDAKYLGPYTNKLMLCAAESGSLACAEYLIEKDIDTTGYIYRGNNVDVAINAMLQSDSIDETTILNYPNLEAIVKVLKETQRDEEIRVLRQQVFDTAPKAVNMDVVQLESLDAAHEDSRNSQQSDVASIDSADSSASVVIENKNQDVADPLVARRLALLARIYYARHLAEQKKPKPDQVHLHNACDLWRRIKPQHMTVQDNRHALKVWSDDKNALSLSKESYFDTQIRRLRYQNHLEHQCGHKKEELVVALSQDVNAVAEQEKHAPLARVRGLSSEKTHEEIHELKSQLKRVSAIIPDYPLLIKSMSKIVDYLNVRQRQTGTYKIGYSQGDYDYRQQIALKLAGFKHNFEKSIELEGKTISKVDTKPLDAMVAEIEAALKSSAITGRWGCFSSHRFADHLTELHAIISIGVLSECPKPHLSLSR
jgi:hypothetical protein